MCLFYKIDCWYGCTLCMEQKLFVLLSRVFQINLTMSNLWVFLLNEDFSFRCKATNWKKMLLLYNRWHDTHWLHPRKILMPMQQFRQILIVIHCVQTTLNYGSRLNGTPQNALYVLGVTIFKCWHCNVFIWLWPDGVTLFSWVYIYLATACSN